MKSTLRRIGNSRGIIIPAALLAACDIQDEIELTLEQGRLIIEPVRPARAGWFDGYTQEQDTDAWADLADTAREQENWQW
jgi:antitoxin MazE